MTFLMTIWSFTWDQACKDALFLFQILKRKRNYVFLIVGISQTLSYKSTMKEKNLGQKWKKK
jgi:hypothetical protein